MKALRILSILVALTLVVGLVASCAPPATEVPPVPTEAPPEPTDVPEPEPDQSSSQ